MKRTLFYYIVSMLFMLTTLNGQSLTPISVDTNGTVLFPSLPNYTFPGTLSDYYGDLRTAITGVSDSLNEFAATDFVTGGTTNTSRVGLSDLAIEGPLTTRTDTYTGDTGNSGVITIDLSAAADFTLIAATNVLSIGFSNVPDTTGTVMKWTGIVTNSWTNTTSIEWGSASPTTLVPVTELTSEDVYEWKIESRDNVLRYSYLGPQSTQLPPELGGTGLPTGEAKDPLSVVVTPTYSGTGLTNAEIDLASARVFRLSTTKDTLINSTASRLTTTQTNSLERIRYVELIRPTADRIVWVNTNNFDLRGVEQSNFVAAGTSWRAELINWGSGVSHNSLYGGGATSVAGGGDTTTDLNDYLAAAWLGTNASGNLTDSTGNGLTGGMRDGFGFTYSQPGHIEANSITNATAGNTGITNSTLGDWLRGTNSWTIMGWHIPNSITANRYFAASWNNGVADSWRAFTGTDGQYKLNIYTNSGSGHSWDTGLYAALAKTHWAIAYDKDAKQLRMVVNGVQASTNLLAVLDSPASAFSIGGYWGANVLNTAFRGNIEQILVYTNYSMPLDDIQRIYNAGTGKAFSTF